MKGALQAIKGSASASTNPPATPCHPPPPYASPTVPRALRVDSTTQSPVPDAQHIMDDQPVWSGKLIWYCGGLEVEAPVQATNPIRDLCVHFFIGLPLAGDLSCLYRRISMWPTDLRLEIIEAEMSSLDFQALLHNNKAPVGRLQSPPGIENYNFGELIKTLRKGKSVSRYDSGQACPSRIGRSRFPVLGGRPRSRTKALASRASFWHRLAKVYSALFYPPLNSRRPFCSTRNKRPSCQQTAALRLIFRAKTWSCCREKISAVKSRMASRIPTRWNS